MKVKELKAALESFPDDMDIVWTNDTGSSYGVYSFNPSELKVVDIYQWREGKSFERRWIESLDVGAVKVGQGVLLYEYLE